MTEESYRLNIKSRKTWHLVYRCKKCNQTHTHGDLIALEDVSAVMVNNDLLTTTHACEKKSSNNGGGWNNGVMSVGISELVGFEEYL